MISEVFCQHFFATIGNHSMRRQLRVISPLLVLATLLVGLCQASLGQGDADLEAPGLAPPATVVSGETTLFQGVRIFDGKSAALSAPSNVLVKETPLNAYLLTRSPWTRGPMSASLRQRAGADARPH